MIETIAERGITLGIRPLYQALVLPRATDYRQRWRRAGPGPRRVRGPRALTAVEQQRGLTVLQEPRFADRAPSQV